MEITNAALDRIKRLKDGKPGCAALRLGFTEKTVYLKWARGEPRDNELLIVRQGFPIFIDSQTYLRLTEYVLDFETGGESSRFVFRRCDAARVAPDETSTQSRR